MRLNKSKAQVTLEMAIALIGVLILLFGTLNLFIWVNKRLVERQQDYENTRVTAGSSATADEIQVNESGHKLNIFANFWRGSSETSSGESSGEDKGGCKDGGGCKRRGAKR